MTSNLPPDPEPGTGPTGAKRPVDPDRPRPGERHTPEFHGLFGRRRARIAAEIQRNRAKEYRVPTWVLGLILALLVAAVVLAVVL